MKKTIYLVSVLLLLFPPLIHAEGGGPYSIAGFDDAGKVKPFVENIKKLVAQDKKEELAQLIRYPLKITVAGRRIVLRTPKDFLKHYDQAFNAKVREALSKQDSK